MRTEPRGSSGDGREAGFALAVVVLLLFAIGVAGAAGYQVIQTEAFQAQRAAETEQALSVAQAGLEWFVGGQRGTIPDSMIFSLNGGSAFVRARRIATLSADQDLYLVRSEGTFTDRRFPQIPAVRITSQYAIYRKTVPDTLPYLALISNSWWEQR